MNIRDKIKLNPSHVVTGTLVLGLGVALFAGGWTLRESTYTVLPGPQACVEALDATAKAATTGESSIASAITDKPQPERQQLLDTINVRTKECKGAIKGHKGLEATND